MKLPDCIALYFEDSYDEAPAGSAQRQAHKAAAQLGKADVINIAAQLQTLLKAGLALVPALKAMEEEFAGSPCGQVVGNIRGDVEAGVPLVEALGKFDELFDSVFVSMVAAAHTSGKLEDALGRIVLFMEKKQQLSQAIKTAAAYPLVTSVVALGVVGFLLSYVVPNIAEIFDQMNTTLPGATVALIGISEFAARYLLVILIGLAVSAVAVHSWLKSPTARQSFDRYKLEIPVLGKLMRKSEIARISRTLGTLLASDVPLIKALEITEPVTANTYAAKAISSLRTNIEKGTSVAQAAQQTDFFSPLVYHMLSAGQVSGNLEQSLEQIARMYEQQVATATKMLTTLLEPAMLIVMGAVIAFIVTAILLPILEMNQLF